MLFNSAQTIGTTIALLLIAGSGVASYADQVATASVRNGFRLGYVVFLVCAVLAFVLGVARGGPWRITGAVQHEARVVGSDDDGQPVRSDG